MILQNSVLKYCSTFILTLFISSNSNLFSQIYKTILINKESKNIGVIKNSTIPISSQAFTFRVKKKCYTYSTNNTTVLRKTEKIVLFKIDMKDYDHNEQLHVKFSDQILTNTNLERPLISAFFDTSSKVRVIPEKYCCYNHEVLKAEHQLSILVDTTLRFLYIVIAFPQSFNSQLTYSISCKSQKPDIKKEFGYSNTLYWHQYDYIKHPPFFMESSFYEPYLICSTQGVNLNEPALKKPHIKEGKDSLFYNKWMTKFIELAEKDTSVVLDCNPMVEIEMHFDSTGKLITCQFSPVNEFTNEKYKNSFKDCAHLLNQSFPKTYTWTPALNFEEQPFNYTYSIMFGADFCWN